MIFEFWFIIVRPYAPFPYSPLHKSGLDVYNGPDPRIFLEDIDCCCFWEFFHVWKPCFWIFIKKNFLVAYIFKCLALQKNLYWQDLLNFVKKNLEMIPKNTFFLYFDENKRQCFLAKTSFSVFNGVWRRPIEHTKTFSAKCFIIFKKS